eukprot:Opistho-2@23991
MLRGRQSTKRTIYLDLDGSGGRNFVLAFFTFLILLNNLIPISLIVTLEVVKFIQATFINNDIEMYHADSDTPALARTSNLNEELGQVKYIFSDKTGTLTCNIMEFRRASVAGISYGQVGDGSGEATQSQSASKSAGRPPMGASAARLVNESTGSFIDVMPPTVQAPAISDPALLENMTNGHPTASVIREFLTLLAVCHTVIPERNKENPGEIIYQASSPDEGALVRAVKQLGFSFNVRTPDSVIINALGREETYKVMNVLEFNSTRKRMSVIVQCPDGRLKLYCKGADTVIYERLSSVQPFAEATNRHLEEFANQGLRTLCLGVAELNQQRYEQWAKGYHAASIAIENREELMDKSAEEIETNLFLLGATAIEDKLQDGVPETIKDLSDAGIKIWVLTGDKQETAINIGFSCKLLTEGMTLLACNETTKDATRNYILGKLRELEDIVGSESQELALIIDGHSLLYALDDDIKKDFLRLAHTCRAVICCRVSPLQKAEVVRLVRDNSGAITLAIGDGANDVGMIQAAHVGVGISGQEGLQAARAADYAIAQFRFLKRLLLVHGAWSYARLSKVILFCFYKNIALYFIEFWFAMTNGFSGQILFDKWLLALYNVLFTVLPPLAIGVFDRDVSAEMLMKVPQLYSIGQTNSRFNTRVFWGWCANAIFHSLLLFWLPLAACTQDVIFGNGQGSGMWLQGLIVFTCAIITVTLKAGLITTRWTRPVHIAIWGSLFIWLFFILIYGAVWPGMGSIGTEMYAVDKHMFASGVFWFLMFIVPVICLFRDYTWKTAQRMFFPRPIHIVQEMEMSDADVSLFIHAFSAASAAIRRIPHMIGLRNRGFAFSQEEKGQADLIRKYDSNMDKPEG